MTGARPGRRTVRRAPRRRIASLLLWLVLAAVTACARGSGVAPAPAPVADEVTPVSAPSEAGESRFRLALDHIQREEFEAATRELAQLAGTCESGPWGRNAILVLASLELNPRNAAGSPSVGAQLAARYLQRPAVPEATLAVAETLYLLAVDLGAEPVTNSLGASLTPVEAALQIEDCNGTEVPTPARKLPLHPGPSTTRGALVTAASQRDSLAAVADSLALRAAELEAELARIRRLLVPDSVGSGGDWPSHRP